MRNLLRIIIGLLMICIMIGALNSQILAQDGSTPSLKVESINVENLPEVSILIQGESLNGALEELPLSIREDGVNQEILSSKNVEKSLYISLVVDPALDLTSVGKSGDGIQFEIANGASSLIQSGILSVRTDWLTAFAASEETQTLMQLSDWQRDHQAVVNAIYQYEPVNSIEPENPVEVLRTVIDSLNSDPVPSDSQRTIVFFSNGASLLGNSEINDTILYAQEQEVAIQVVLLGEGNTLARQNLMGLSAVTGGRFVTYENASSLMPIWDDLEQGSQFLELTYRLGSGAPKQIAIALQDGDDESVVATEDFPEISLEPVQVSIVSPDADFNLELIDVPEDSNSAGQMASLLPVELEFGWPDGVERDIAAVEYTLGDVTYLQNQPPFNSYEINDIALDEGVYSLDVNVIDEFSLRGEAEPIAINISIDNLPESVGTEAGASSSDISSNISTGDLASPSNEVQVDASNQGMNILGLQLPETIDIFGVTFLVNGITLLIALFPIIFLLALFLYWLTQRNEQPAEQDYGYYEYDNNGYFYRFEPSADDMQLTQPQVSVIEPEEELTMPVKLPSFYTNAAAYLVYISGGDHLPKKIAIETNEPVRIGRKKSFCDQILDDQRVSRLHSVLTFEGGDFYIKDEGSSGGTFVNRRKLGPTDKQVLDHNDIINFNEVEYRMEIPEPVAEGNDNSAAEPASDAESILS